MKNQDKLRDAIEEEVMKVTGWEDTEDLTDRLLFLFLKESKQREKELDIKQHFNEPQAESLERLGDAVRGMHNADIKVRVDGRDIWFEADWLRQIVPILLKALERTK